MASVQWHTLAALALGGAFVAGLALSSWREPAGGRCAAGAKTLQRIELVFGLSRKVGGDVGEAEWLAFIDAEVTPRFPDGLTVLAGHGQWRNAKSEIVKEPSRVLLVWAELSADLDARIEAVRAAWKGRHDQESVLRAGSVSCVSF